MKKLLLLPLLALSVHAASFTDFYMDTTGSPTNSGHTDSLTPKAAGQNGNWDDATGIYLFAAATDLSAVTNGDWAAIYLDAATSTPFVGRITAVDDGADSITVSQIYSGGNPPTTAATGISCTIGGRWIFPTGSTTGDFPFQLVDATMINSVSNPPCVNVRSNLYSTTATITCAGSGRYQGYTNTPHDLGKTLVQSATGAAYDMFLVTGSLELHDFELDSQATSSVGDIVQTQGRTRLWRVIIHDARESGIEATTGSISVDQCEVYNCSSSGIIIDGTTWIINNTICWSNGASGFALDEGGTVVNSIAYSNVGSGFAMSASTDMVGAYGCDAYGNGASGFQIGSTLFKVTLVNCNALANGTFGFSLTPAIDTWGNVLSPGLGTGTMTNVSGNFNQAASDVLEIIGTTFYPANVTHWIDPTRANFSLNRAYAKVGYGSFTQKNVNAPTNTISFPVIGAIQYPATNILGGNYVWGQ